MLAGSAGILHACCQRVCSCRSLCPRKARHKPIGYRQHFRRFHNTKTEALIKTYIFTLIRFQVCRGASAISYHAKGVEHSGADPLPPENGLDGDRTKMPVRFGWIPPSPLADPIQDANGCCNRIADHRRISTLIFSITSGWQKPGRAIPQIPTSLLERMAPR